MDTLEILTKAEELGGQDRRKAMMKAIIKARQLGCDATPGGGKVGGFNIRYGSLKYAVMDLNTRGEVFLHLKAHPNKDLSEDMRDRGNEFVNQIEGITIKNSPINHYGQIEGSIEELPDDAIDRFLEYAVEVIRENYYRPHLEG
ncbi:MAG: hypothetical protein H0U74_02920 [Bradymonadaceae bacterium]|nr:hypothetical protein [Lujinxingiaceae bacterium]